MNIVKVVTEYLPKLVPGLITSALLLASLVAIGTPLALLLAIMQRTRYAVVRWTSILVVEIGRGIPSLLLLYIVYFGLPVVEVTFDSFTSAALALALNFAAYTSQSIKAGLDAIPLGQIEAANALALGRWTKMRFIVFPQSLRIITPSMLSWVIVYLQTTSIGFAIAVPELMYAAYSIAATNFKYLELFLLAGLLYAFVSIPGSQIVTFLERSRTRSP
jgi:polar amino acid transport system permease protein